MSLGKTLNPELLLIELAAPCMVAANHWVVSEWVNERPLKNTLGSREGAGKLFMSAVNSFHLETT